MTHASRTRNTRLRRLLAPVLAVGVAALGLAVAPSSAQADDSGTLTVVGTTDVSDSNLVAGLLEPGFEAAFPSIDFKYVPLGTGAAITYAESGAASALIVHAASLENQFVQQHYSLEQYGRAIFWGDYVLLAPASDPAHVMTGTSHDIVGAFEKIAAAGADGDANFVSRGGTPGTTVAEHSIWGLTTNVQTCTVSDPNGGGTAPSTTTGACPTTATPPDWYHITGASQANNLINADACNYTGVTTNNCYVLTDRGTYAYQKSIGSIHNLDIAVRDNDKDARGTNTLLVNSFHAYAINPAKFSGDVAAGINTDAATKFLNWVTSAATQAKIATFQDANDPPFIPDATPTLTHSTLPSAMEDGSTFTVSGTLANVVPGTPALSGVTVKLMRVPNFDTTRAPTLQTSAVTDSKGHYSISYKPHLSGRYSLVVDPISKVELPGLTPVFGDLLNGVDTSIGSVHIQGGVTITSATHTGTKLTLKGTVTPAVRDDNAHLSLYGVKTADLADGLHYIAQKPLADGATSFTVSFTTTKSAVTVQLKYVNEHYIDSGLSSKKKVAAG